LGESADEGDFLAAFIEDTEDMVVSEGGDFAVLDLIGGVFRFEGEGYGFAGAEGLFGCGEARAQAMLRLAPLWRLGRGRARRRLVFPIFPVSAEPTEKQIHVHRGIAFENLSQRIQPLEHVEIEGEPFLKTYGAPVYLND